jgi:predicted Holliday junction resolvase-like endonuclease
MVWVLIVILALVAFAAVLALLAMAELLVDDAEAERVRIEMEVRRAERRLHDVASRSFQAMLEEARAHRSRVR